MNTQAGICVMCLVSFLIPSCHEITLDMCAMCPIPFMYYQHKRIIRDQLSLKPKEKFLTHDQV